MTTYEKIIQKAVNKETEILGEKTALGIAKEVEGLELDEKGEIKKLEREEQKILEDLVQEYQKIGGAVSASLIAREIEDLVEKDMELPDILLERIDTEKIAATV